MKKVDVALAMISLLTDPNGLWYGFGLRGRVIAYNSEHVLQPPRSLEALLNPKWKGRKLAMSDSHNSPIHASLYQTFNQYRLEKPLKLSYAHVADALPEALKAVRETLN